MSLWLDALKNCPGALDDYQAYLTRRAGIEQAGLDRALTDGDMNKAQVALGKRFLLDTLQADLLRSDQEEAQYAAYVGNVNP